MCTLVRSVVFHGTNRGVSTDWIKMSIRKCKKRVLKWKRYKSKIGADRYYYSEDILVPLGSIHATRKLRKARQQKADVLSRDMMVQ